MTGDVRLKASDGLVATSRQRHLRRRRRHRPGAGAGNVHARGDQGLRRRVHLRLPPRHDVDARPGAGARRRIGCRRIAMDVTAGAFGEARRERYMRLERGVKMVRPGQTIEADEAMVYLLPDRDEPDMIELRGNARITGGAGDGHAALDARSRHQPRLRRRRPHAAARDARRPRQRRAGWCLRGRSPGSAWRPSSSTSRSAPTAP